MIVCGVALCRCAPPSSPRMLGIYLLWQKGVNQDAGSIIEALLELPKKMLSSFPAFCLLSRSGGPLTELFEMRGYFF